MDATPSSLISFTLLQHISFNLFGEIVQDFCVRSAASTDQQPRFEFCMLSKAASASSCLRSMVFSAPADDFVYTGSDVANPVWTLLYVEPRKIQSECVEISFHQLSDLPSYLHSRNFSPTTLLLAYNYSLPHSKPAATTPVTIDDIMLLLSRLVAECGGVTLGGPVSRSSLSVDHSIRMESQMQMEITKFLDVCERVHQNRRCSFLMSANDADDGMVALVSCEHFLLVTNSLDTPTPFSAIHAPVKGGAKHSIHALLERVTDWLNSDFAVASELNQEWQACIHLPPPSTLDVVLQEVWEKVGPFLSKSSLFEPLRAVVKRRLSLQLKHLLPLLEALVDSSTLSHSSSSYQHPGISQHVSNVRLFRHGMKREFMARAFLVQSVWCLLLVGVGVGIGGRELAFGRVAECLVRVGRQLHVALCLLKCEEEMEEENFLLWNGNDGGGQVADANFYALRFRTEIRRMLHRALDDEFLFSIGEKLVREEMKTFERKVAASRALIDPPTIKVRGARRRAVVELLELSHAQRWTLFVWGLLFLNSGELQKSIEHFHAFLLSRAAEGASRYSPTRMN